MTKLVRVENADTSSYKVRVFVEDLIDGQWVRTSQLEELSYPTSLASMYIHSSRRLVVEEYNE